jgi:hypothetical protein
LSLEWFPTSYVVVGEHELVVGLLACVARDHRVAAEHVFGGGGRFMAVSFAGAGSAVVSRVAAQSVRPAIAPVAGDVAIFCTVALGGVGQRRLGGGKGCCGRGCGSLFCMDFSSDACFKVGCFDQIGTAIAASFGGDFAFAFDVGGFEMNFEVAPGLVACGLFSPIQDGVFKLSCLFDAVQFFLHEMGPWPAAVSRRHSLTRTQRFSMGTWDGSPLRESSCSFLLSWAAGVILAYVFWRWSRSAQQEVLANPSVSGLSSSMKVGSMAATSCVFSAQEVAR